MLTRLFRIWTGLSALALLGVVAVAACDLNPQPLPPGATATFGSGEDSGSTVAVPIAGGSDSGGILFGGDGGGPGGNLSPDGGDAESPDASGEGGDAGTLDAGDAATEDASTDAHEDAE